jgi:hypothetical protein
MMAWEERQPSRVKTDLLEGQFAQVVIIRGLVGAGFFR